MIVSPLQRFCSTHAFWHWPVSARQVSVASSHAPQLKPPQLRPMQTVWMNSAQPPEKPSALKRNRIEFVPTPWEGAIPS